jgi:predicted membrane-bound spermidine synthase
MLLALAWVEGAAVMALELIAGQLLSPSFGDSLTTWMWILICTMSGLALGYFTGVTFVSSNSRRAHACWALLAGLIYAAAIPDWFTPLLTRLLDLPIATAVPLAALSIFLVPMWLFGLVPGFLVSASGNDPGGTQPNIPGRIFAFSTCGGIVSAFLVGLVLIPTLGVTAVLRLLALVLGVLPCTALLIERRYLGVVLAVLVGFAVLPASSKLPVGDDAVSILDFQEGLMGQLMVADEKQPGQEQYRYLYVNRTAQTKTKPGGQYLVREQFPYVQTMASVLGAVPHNSRVLLLGLGGGALVKLIRSLGFNLTVVEIDPRIVSVARKFFDLPPDVQIELGDARRYLRLTKDMFDVIVYDVYRGEFLPAHVLTLEALEELKSKLAPGGMVVINVIGTDAGEFGAVTQSVMKTLRAADWRCNIIAPTTQMNSIIIADRGDRSYATRVNESAILDGFPIAQSLFMPESKMEEGQRRSSDIPVLTDDLPVIDQLNRGIVEATRKWYIQTAVKPHVKRDVPLYR